MTEKRDEDRKSRRWLTWEFVTDCVLWSIIWLLLTD